MTPVIFDLDGTLIDSAPDIAAAANAMLAEQGKAALDLATVTSFVGNGVSKLVERVIGATGLDMADHAALTADVARHMHRGDAALSRPYPGVLTALRALQAQGTPMAICTNKPHGPARAILQHLELDGFFAAVIGGDSLPTRKPDPAMLRAAMDGLGADACAYVGDSEVDAETAQNAAQPFFLFTEGYRKTPVAQIPHTVAFGDFAQLPHLLTQN
ncbi:phosphoglycolate phosphatase [Actibacterium mucosum KCTC 23349]|uniref:Phosphoglycolate phosphatase n=1 Tax=Actibacterium mucosum KCTC 23349 TaxID=1454373 RepID=A0A037ZJD3_9RHOB|nr:phosphoglycolate phosphatase [Actibacterium mucosum]KAJ55672.1 phosphoglycolate phosphatase [Actibacterium mucosum KCTC 23349]